MAGFEWEERSDANYAPLTDDRVAAFEREFGIPLPPLLERLLRQQNGGYLVNTMRIVCSDQLTQSEGEDACIDYMSGYRNNVGSGDMSDSEYMVAEWELPQGHVVLVEGNHKFVTLDPTDGSIHWTNSDYEESYVIASSFEEFYNGLVPEE